MGKALSTVPCTLNKTTSRLFLKTWLGHQVLCEVLSPKVSATPRPVARGFLSAIGSRLLPRLNERARPGEETELGIFARGRSRRRDEPGAQGREPPQPQLAPLAPPWPRLPTSVSGSGGSTRRKRPRADRKPRPSRGSAQRYSAGRILG